MTIHTDITQISSRLTAHEDLERYLAAYGAARSRARNSYFPQHIILDADGSYWVADEGNYGALPDHILERIVHTVDAGLSDEY